MDEDTIEVEGESDLKPVSVTCVQCKRPTRHRVVTSVLKAGSSEFDEEYGYAATWHTKYQVVVCQGCNSPSFRQASWFSEEPEGEGIQLYPVRNIDALSAKKFLNVPLNLRRIYRETIDCFNSESQTLCAAGLRALVEGVCAQQGIVDGPAKHGKNGRSPFLEGKIAGLHEKGGLTASSAETLHAHRYLGNEAVHELARPGSDELKLAIEIVEHVLEQLYELPEKAEEIRRIRANR